MFRIPVLVLAAGALLAVARALPEDSRARGFVTEERGAQAYAQPGPLAGTSRWPPSSLVR